MKLSTHSGFRIYKGEILPATLKRVVQEQLNLMLGMSESFTHNPDYVTHEIRKTTKRIRAVNRLFRNALGEAIYIRNKELFGSLSSLLAEHRVSAVHLEILKGIARDAENPLGEKLMNEMITAQQQSHLELTKQLIDKKQTMLSIKQILNSESEKSDRDPIIVCGYHDIVKGLKGTYRGGTKCLNVLTAQPGTENFHNLRKKVKMIWNQLILLRPVWPAMITPMVRQMDLLAEKLGADHDLAELENWVLTGNIGNGHEETILKLISYISGKRKIGQKAIINSALKLYAEKPAAFAGRMATYCRLYWG
ncbi:MAG: CHAD domain-containing protein [Bacteroidales bacterium]